MTMPAQLDTVDLLRQVTALYQRVALEPHASYHFPLGRPLAEQLGYPADLLDRIPTEALASFAGVGYALDLARLTPAEVDYHAAIDSAGLKLHTLRDVPNYQFLTHQARNASLTYGVRATTLAAHRP